MAPSSHSYDDDIEEKHNIFHVLAVDDSNIDRKILERLLTLSEYHVTCVDSGDKALEYLGLISNSTHPHQVSSKVNLIMTDYSMPGITGYDLLKKIKDSSWKDVPVIVMSSENVQSRINMCLEGGAEEFLLKPVKLSDLSKLQSHILKYTFTRESDGGSETTMTDIIDSAIEKEEEKISVTTNNDIIISTNRDEDKEMMIKNTTNNEINNNRDEGEKGENDMNCSNAIRKTTFTTILMASDLPDRMPHVQELPVA